MKRYRHNDFVWDNKWTCCSSRESEFVVANNFSLFPNFYTNTCTLVSIHTVICGGVMRGGWERLRKVCARVCVHALCVCLCACVGGWGCVCECVHVHVCVCM